MKPVYKTESERPSKRWLLAPLAVVAALVFIVAAVVVPVAALRAQAAAARRAWAAETKLAQARRQLAQGAQPARELPRQVERFDTTLIDDTAVGLKPAAVMATKWEYKATSATTDAMNKAGEEGWELVAVTTKTDGAFSTAYFKRAAEKPAFGPATPDGNPRPTEPRRQ
jgi:hypothetical protein